MIKMSQSAPEKLDSYCKIIISKSQIQVFTQSLRKKKLVPIGELNAWGFSKGVWETQTATNNIRL